MNVSTLSPLESAEILGGMADKVVTTTVEVKTVVSVSIITTSGE